MHGTWDKIIETMDKPDPSLCDSCKNAYHMPGGVSMWLGKNYPQRYCSALTISIHSSGKDACDRYEKRTA